MALYIRDEQVDELAKKAQRLLKTPTKTEAVRQASVGPLPEIRPASEHLYNGLSKNAYFRLVDQRTQLLGVIRDQIKEVYDIYPMILSMRNLKKVAYGESTLGDFKDWQKKILLQTADEMQLDISILHS